MVCYCWKLLTFLTIPGIQIGNKTGIIFVMVEKLGMKPDKLGNYGKVNKCCKQLTPATR